MSRQLELALSDQLQLYGERVHNHVKELRVKEGVADFVLSPTPLNGERLRWISKLASAISSPSVATVASYLSATRPHTVGEITAKSGLTRDTVARAMSRLVDRDVVGRTQGVGFLLKRPIREADLGLWALELKLKDWKRGMYQALQYKAFAHSVAIVVPRESREVVSSRLGQFRAHRVGILTFDMTTGAIRVLVRPGRSHPKSLEHYLYALSVFVRGLPWHPDYGGPPKAPALPHQQRRNSQPRQARR